MKPGYIAFAVICLLTHFIITPLQASEGESQLSAIGPSDNINTRLEALRKAVKVAEAAKDWTQAVHIWTQVLTIRPDDVEALLGRADAQSELEQHALALADDRKAVELSPNNVKAWNSLCWHSISAGDWSPARAACERGHSLAPHIMATNVNLGHTYFLLGDLDKARKWYEKTIPLLENEDDLVAGPLSDFNLFIRRGWQIESSKQLRAWFADQGRQWLKGISLNQQVINLYQQGKYADALPLAQQSLEIFEKTLGPEHPDVATGLTSLARLYDAQDRYAEAERLYKRGLAIREKFFGPEHPNVAECLNRLGELSLVQGRYNEAEFLYERALVIYEKSYGRDAFLLVPVLQNLGRVHEAKIQLERAESLWQRSLAIVEKEKGPDHPDGATIINRIGDLRRKQGDYSKAVLLYKRALEIREIALGPEHPLIAQSLKGLGEVLTAQGQYAHAEPLLIRSLTMQEKVLGPKHRDVALNLDSLALLYIFQGKRTQAEQLIKRALDIQEKTLGTDHYETAKTMNILAGLYRDQSSYTIAEGLYNRVLAIYEKIYGAEQPNYATTLHNMAILYEEWGRYDLAEQFSKRAITIHEKVLGAEHPYLAENMQNLSKVYAKQGRYAEAETHSKQALSILEKVLGRDHPSVALSLSFLSGIYQQQGRYLLAEPLLKRALEINEKALGSEHRNVAVELQNLAALYQLQGKYELSEQHYKRALAISERVLGSEHPQVASILSNLGTLYDTQGRYLEAEQVLHRGLAVREKVLGQEHPSVAYNLNNLGLLYKAQGQYAKAAPLLERSLTIFEKTLVSDNPSLAIILNNLAAVYEAQGEFIQALALVRKASTLYRSRIVHGGSGDDSIHEAAMNKDGFFLHLYLLLSNPGKEPAEKVIDEAFQIAQLEQASGTASAVAKMAARFARGDNALAGLVKRKQDAVDRRIKAEALLVQAAGKPPTERNTSQEEQLRNAIKTAGTDIRVCDAELDRRFPEYQELNRPEPLAVHQVRSLLHPGEAMLVYALGSSGYLWVVKPQGAVWFIPLKVSVREVADRVMQVRSGMEFDGQGKVPPVRVDTLHDLYRKLLAPARPHLTDVRHVMIVPAGPLQSLPFGMMVASPATKISTDTDYRNVDWLARHYAFSVLPAVSSIRAFRQFAKSPGVQEPFIGFGDPLIGERGGTTRGKQVKLEVDKIVRGVNIKRMELRHGVTSEAMAEVADVDAIRMAPRLPETADELLAMSHALGAGSNSLWLQDKASETRVKSIDLSRFRTVAFATHGVLAGEIRGIGEPGLILTPPREGSPDDDGYLSAGEVAKLNLNADWVLLSACNTAGPDGTPGAEGLSGLTKAFFYAGARSLLVSHWPVSSEATVGLTTTMLNEYKANPKEGKAEAHRKAMLAVMRTSAHPEYAHPLYWAPFVVVGEGGSGNRDHPAAVTGGGMTKPTPSN